MNSFAEFTFLIFLSMTEAAMMHEEFKISKRQQNRDFLYRQKLLLLFNEASYITFVKFVVCIFLVLRVNNYNALAIGFPKHGSL